MPSPSVRECELFALATGAWTATGSLGVPRAGHSVTTLADGRVLAAGGSSTWPNAYTGGPKALSSAELFSPGSDVWTATGSMAEARYAHAATLLPDGRVMVTGGVSNTSTLSSCELYDPATGLWSSAPSMGAPRSFHRSTALPGARVLVTGGFASDQRSAYIMTEMLSVADNAWQPAGPMGVGRSSHSATLLPDGRVVAIGGLNTLLVCDFCARAHCLGYLGGGDYVDLFDPQVPLIACCCAVVAHEFSSIY